MYKKHLGKFKKLKNRIKDRVCISKNVLPFRNVISHSIHEKFLKLLQFLPKKLPTYTINKEPDEIICGKIYQKTVDQNQLKMESFTIELVSKESAQLLPDTTLSSFTNILPEQLNLEGRWQGSITEISYPSTYQNFTAGKFLFFDSKFPKLSELPYLEPGFHPSVTDIVEAKNTLIHERHNYGESCITVKVSLRTQRSLVVTCK